MSTQPPNTPPYGAPPGTDPRDWARQQREYWKQQRQQNRDYYRAQRDQWRAAYQPQRRSFIGPVVLICVGILGTLVYAGRISGERFWDWYAHWWPLLLILTGVALIVEWMLDRDEPFPRRHGGLGFLITLIIITGVCATGFTHWGWHHDLNFDDDDDARRFFSGPEHDSTANASATAPSGASLQVHSNIRGDVNITTVPGDQVNVVLHRRIFGGSDSEAASRAEDVKPIVNVSGNVVSVTVDGKDSAMGDLQITVPEKMSADVTNTRGDLSISGLQGNVTFNGHHGSTRLRDITGNITLRGDGGDVSLQQAKGDVTLNGKFDNVDIADVRGMVGLNGDFEGDIGLHSINGLVHFHSSRTDITLGRIDGQLSLDGEDLHVSSAQGPLTLSTKDKQVELTNVSGDISVTNSNGDVNVTPALPLGNIRIDNHGENVRVTLPASAGFQLHAEAHDGNIENDFGLSNQSQGSSQNSTFGTVGDGRLNVQVVTRGGDISIRKAASAETIPPAPPAAPAPPPMPTVTAPGVPAPPPAPKITKAPKAPRAPKSPDTTTIVDQ